MGCTASTISDHDLHQEWDRNQSIFSRDTLVKEVQEATIEANCRLSSKHTSSQWLNEESSSDSKPTVYIDGSTKRSDSDEAVEKESVDSDSVEACSKLNNYDGNESEEAFYDGSDHEEDSDLAACSTDNSDGDSSAGASLTPKESEMKHISSHSEDQLDRGALTDENCYSSSGNDSEYALYEGSVHSADGGDIAWTTLADDESPTKRSSKLLELEHKFNEDTKARLRLAATSLETEAQKPNSVPLTEPTKMSKAILPVVLTMEDDSESTKLEDDRANNSTGESDDSSQREQLENNDITRESDDSYRREQLDTSGTLLLSPQSTTQNNLMQRESDWPCKILNATLNIMVQRESDWNATSENVLHVVNVTARSPTEHEAELRPMHTKLDSQLQESPPQISTPPHREVQRVSDCSHRSPEQSSRDSLIAQKTSSVELDFPLISPLANIDPPFLRTPPSHGARVVSYPSLNVPTSYDNRIDLQLANDTKLTLRMSPRLSNSSPFNIMLHRESDWPPSLPTLSIHDAQPELEAIEAAKFPTEGAMALHLGTPETKQSCLQNPQQHSADSIIVPHKSHQSSDDTRRGVHTGEAAKLTLRMIPQISNTTPSTMVQPESDWKRKIPGHSVVRSEPTTMETNLPTEHKTPLGSILRKRDSPFLSNPKSNPPRGLQHSKLQEEISRLREHIRQRDMRDTVSTPNIPRYYVKSSELVFNNSVASGVIYDSCKMSYHTAKAIDRPISPSDCCSLDSPHGDQNSIQVTLIDAMNRIEDDLITEQHATYYTECRSSNGSVKSHTDESKMSFFYSADSSSVGQLSTESSTLFGVDYADYFELSPLEKKRRRSCRKVKDQLHSKAADEGSISSHIEW